MANEGPPDRELAMGAIASGGVRVLNDDVVNWYKVPDGVINEVARKEQAELERHDLLLGSSGPVSRTR
jgi:putative phosphoribosyl transferase